LAAETSERRRAILTIVATHVEAEVRGDIPALMETLVPDPQYHFWGAVPTSGPKGRAETEAHYQGLVATGMNRLEFAVDRVVVDDGNLITEGVFRHAVSGALIEPLGAAATGRPVSPEGWYLVEYRALVVWPVTAEGLIVGEDIFFGSNPQVVRALGSGELPHLGPPDRP
jgi:hypothetical protein